MEQVAEDERYGSERRTLIIPVNTAVNIVVNTAVGIGVGVGVGVGMDRES